jgi:hypothetical protein
MADVPFWDRGSKRRIARIHWKRWEVVHAVILALLAIAFSLWVGFWIATHSFD